MKDIILAFDLDSTIMHSRRNFAQTDICIEHIKGEPRGFMKPTILSALQNVSRYARFVPVTSRSLDQYKRIEWGEVAVSEAYVDNGVRLIKQGDLRFVVDENEIINPYLCYLQKAINEISCIAGIRKARIVDECYVVFLYDNWESVSEAFAKYNSASSLRLFVDKKKIYLFPPKVEKRIAIEHLRNRYENSIIICAGDSMNDLSMMAVSDLAIVPEEIAAKATDFHLPDNTVVCPKEESFEDFIAGWLLKELPSYEQI